MDQLTNNQLSNLRRLLQQEEHIDLQQVAAALQISDLKVVSIKRNSHS